MHWPHPDYLTAFLTGEQLAGWIDYSSREPFGFPHDDVRWSMLTAMVGNAGPRHEPFSPEAFMLGPNLADPPNEDGTPSDDALIRKLKQLLPPPPKTNPAEGV